MSLLNSIKSKSKSIANWCQFFQINFPAVTVCPRHKFQIARSPFRSRQKHHKYEKHSLSLLHYEHEEEVEEFVDERRFRNISYVEFLDRIDNGSIKPDNLGLKL